jgi:hypothetical protein
MIIFLQAGQKKASLDELQIIRYLAKTILFIATPNFEEPLLDSPLGDQLNVS